MIIGIGIDIVELARIGKQIEAGEGLAKRVLTEAELNQYRSLTIHRKVEFLAGRFAAKEAVSKAFGTGIGKELSFKQIEVLQNELGAPIMKLDAPLLNIKDLRIHLSISHGKEQAIAQVILERLNEE